MKKVLLFYAAIVALGVVQAHAESLTGWKARLMRAESACDRVLVKRASGVRICFDDQMKGARAVWYVLRGDLVNKRNIKRRPRFYPDPGLPARLRARPEDYARNRWRMDRGHLAPDADFDWAAAPLREVYAMSNIVPQHAYVNRKLWARAERYERAVARKAGRAIVINGVVYPRRPARLRGGEAIPSGFWKIVVPRGGRPKCFFFPNRADQPRGLKAHLVRCPSIRVLFAKASP